MIIKMILTNAFDPDPRVYKEAVTLTNHGHDVEILAWDRESKYKRNHIEMKDGVTIKRFFSNGKYGSGIKQLLGYINFLIEVINYLKDNKYDCIHCHDFDTLFIGYLFKLKNKNLKLVYDEHDLFYLYFKNRKGIPNFILSQFIRWSELYFLKRVDHHIVVTNNMKELYRDKINSIVITNAPLKNSFSHIEKIKRNKIVIGFIGSVRYLNELKVLIDVASHFENITVFIAGKGIKLNELEVYITQKGYQNVEIFGEYKFNQLEDLYSRIDITYLIYPLQATKISLPNKFFESIITETPIIAEAKAEYGQIVSSNGLGWIIDSNNLERSLKQVFTDITFNDNNFEKFKNNMKSVKENYYWESNINKLCDIYK